MRRGVPYERTLFVCVHARQDGRKACANPGSGGAELCESLKSEIKARGLKGRVRVARSGCLDLCEQGPNVFLFPDGDWLSGAKPEDAPRLLAGLSEAS